MIESSPRPWLHVSGYRFRLWPLVLAAMVMQLCLVPARELARWIFKGGPPHWAEHAGLFVFSALMLQGLCGLVAIAAMRRWLPTADPHLRWPPGDTGIGLATAIGVGMGVVMLVGDYAPELLAGVPPRDYPIEPGPAAGWLLAMITTGLGEETIFRGLLVGMLVVLAPGRIRMGRFEIPIAGVWVAVLFALAHYQSFLHAPLARAIIQQIYAFAWGLVYVWLMERTRSLVAPIVAHGVGNFVETAIAMALLAAWG